MEIMGIGLDFSTGKPLIGTIDEQAFSEKILGSFPHETLPGLSRAGTSAFMFRKEVEREHYMDLGDPRKAGWTYLVNGNDPQRDEITQAIVDSVPQVPVTVKMRAGWDLQSIIVEKAGVLLENAGVKAITLHPRTAKQTYKGNANWQLIKLLKETVSIPIIGNGDIKTADDVLRMFNETGCDAVMVGRVALGNPWFFKRARALLQGKIVAEPSVEDRVKLCKRHFDLILQSRGISRGLYLMRKHFGWYIKGFPGASGYRTQLVEAKSIEIAEEVLNEIIK